MTTPSAAAPPASAIASTPRQPPAACSEPAPAADARRDTAVDLLLQGAPRAAASLLDAELHERPQDLAAEALYLASTQLGDAENANAAERLGAALPLEPLAVETHGVSDIPPHAAISGSLELLKELEHKPNKITDDAAWFARTGITIPSTGPDAAPEHVASRLGRFALTRLFRHPDHTIALYGGLSLVVSAPGRPSQALRVQFADAAGRALEIQYAQVVGSQLLVELAYNGYAAASSGHNAYLAAFELTTGRLRWLGPALAANAQNFVVIGDNVVTGYGFTAEPDYVFVLGLKAGELRQKLDVHGAPSYLGVLGDRLFVRTYDTDYVFGINVPAAPTNATSMTADASSVSASARCWLRTALARVEARDVTGVSAALSELKRSEAQNTAVVLEGLSITHPSLDLWSVAPLRLAAPPWKYTLAARSDAPQPTAAAKLVELKAGRADPVRALDEKPYAAEQPYFIAPAEQGALPAGARADIPSFYGRESLRAIIPSGAHTLLIYGSRYLISVQGARAEQVFDFDAFLVPPSVDESAREFAIEDVSFAQVVGQTVYVCNGGGSYAREVAGKKGFVSALAFESGQLLWRSDALVCNASFAVANHHLISGYGFTSEPDHVFALRMSDGKKVASASVASAPETISVSGDNPPAVHVEAYAHVYDFALR